MITELRRWMLLVEAQGRVRFLHGSQHELPIGTILKPYGSGTDGDIEAILEIERPANRSPRNSFVYMARDVRTLENVARSGDFIYVVEPIGTPLRFDAAWINRLWTLYARNEDNVDSPEIVAKAKKFARGYWSGRACPSYGPGHEAIWDYAAPSARVIRDVTDARF